MNVMNDEEDPVDVLPTTEASKITAEEPLDRGPLVKKVTSLDDEEPVNSFKKEPEVTD